MRKRCTICDAPFQSPPSAKTVTCSRDCSREHRSRTHLGKSNVWSTGARARKAAAGQTDNLALGTPAASASPRAGPFETNIHAKTWLVTAPGGAPTYEVRNLRLWCERHAVFFAPDPWQNAYAGLRMIVSLRRRPEKRRASQWKGWRVEIIE